MQSLTIVAGKPYNRNIKVKDGKNIWPNLSDFQVVAELRASPDSTSRLISQLQSFMTKSFVGNDIVIPWRMTGVQTRTLYGLQWGRDKTGYVNIVISDANNLGVQKLVVPVIQILAEDITTLGG